MSNVLFDDNNSDDDIAFNKSEYAKKYDTLRRKEELLKLKNKYGDKFDGSEDSSSSEDDDEDVELTEEFEKDFFKTLSCLKNKDPKIYDKDIRFFNAEAGNALKDKKEKYKPMKIRDYNRELILNEHKSDEEEEAEERPASPTYVQEQNEIKNTFQKIVNDNDERDSDELGGLFVKKNKSKTEEEEEEKSYREWLKGQFQHLNDDAVESELKPLREYWSNPLLDKDEAFLRDYVLNQRFKDPTFTKKIPSYEEIVNDSEDNISEDEQLIGRQAEFEHKFNFRFEEPDQEFIKQYPRTLEHTMRQKSDKRAQKRAEIKERKTEEKLKKKEEISRMKSLKLKEIQEKITKIKEITGNDELAFNNEDIEGDFDPEEHDRRMHEIFDEEYYDHDVDRKKPTFPELDEELGIENWDKWGKEGGNEVQESELHCEDENFNMDCDYNAAAPKKSLLDELKDTIEGKNKRKRKRKGKFSEALEREKPLYNPENLNKTLSQYVDEYYKLDCEDIIGDLPCRFKYREVPACNYGLSLEEILMADDKELNRWYSLKKTLAHRPEHLQRNDQKIYEKKANDIALKMKILPSLFKPHELENADAEDVDITENVTKKKKKKNKKKRKTHDTSLESKEIINGFTVEENVIDENVSKKKKNKNVSEADVINIEENSVDNSANKTDENISVSKKIKRKQEKPVEENVDNNLDTSLESNEKVNGFIVEENVSKKKKHKIVIKDVSGENVLKIDDNNVSEPVNKTASKKKLVEKYVDNSLSTDTKSSKKRKHVSESCNEDSMHIDQNDVSEEIEKLPKSKRRRKKKPQNSGESDIAKEALSQENADKKLHKIKSKGIIKHKQKNYHNNKKDENGIASKLTDERLKAFGLNPKKYRSFMKFKKH